MCYLIAKKHNQSGCIAYETEGSKALASYLGLKTLDKDIQILTLTDMDTYGEYKSYKNMISLVEGSIEKGQRTFL